MQAPDILVVVVLYRCPPAESRSLTSLIQLLSADASLAEHFSIVVYDNSPRPHDLEMTAGVPTVYHHDAENPGLAVAYNFALAQAEKDGHDWLLLFDQDTSPTGSFLEELIDCVSKELGDQDVASIVPKLLVGGQVYSPAAHFIDQVRHQYRRSNHAVGRNIVGVQRRLLSAYNSGATLRVSAMKAIGGFPTDYWLDFLDHATFHSLSAHGYFMYVMRSEIHHEASQSRIAEVPLWRQRNLLFAQMLFVTEAGNFVDRCLYRLFLLRCSLSMWRRYGDKGLWKETAWQALVLNGGGRKSTVYGRGDNQP